MRRGAPVTIGLLVLVAFLGFTIFFPGESLAIVADATFTGGGLGPTTITVTNEETKESATRERDATGAPVIIPLESRNWRAGNHYTVTFTDPSTGKPVTVRGVDLKDGRNRFDLGALAAMAGRAAPPAQLPPGHVVDLHAGIRFFDIHGIGPSFGLRGDYSPPLVFIPEIFNLRPYASVWGVPWVNINSNRPFDHGGNFQDRIDSGSMFGLNVGLKHVSNLAKWGMTTGNPDYTLVGIVMMGIGWVYYCFDMERLDNPNLNTFTEARNFNASGNGLRLETNIGIAASSRDGYFAGFKAGVAPTRIDIFNGGPRWRTEGNISLVFGKRFSL